MVTKQEHTVLMKVGSNLDYEIRLGKDGQVYCSCSSWRFSKKVPKTCKHLEEFLYVHKEDGIPFAVTGIKKNATEAVKKLSKHHVKAIVHVVGAWFVLYSKTPGEAKKVLGSKNPIGYLYEAGIAYTDDPKMANSYNMSPVTYSWSHLPTGETGTTKIYIRYPEDIVKLLNVWNRGKDWKYTYPNPTINVSSDVVKYLNRVKADKKAGHDADDYWEGAAAGALIAGVANPKNYLNMTPQQFYDSDWYKKYEYFKLIDGNRVLLKDKDNKGIMIAPGGWFEKLQRLEQSEENRFWAPKGFRDSNPIQSANPRMLRLVDRQEKGWHYGDRVEIKAGLKEFIGKTGYIIGAENEYLRVNLDTPVNIPGVGKVEDDLWIPSTLKKIKGYVEFNPVQSPEDFLNSKGFQDLDHVTALSTGNLLLRDSHGEPIRIVSKAWFSKLTRLASMKENPAKGTLHKIGHEMMYYAGSTSYPSKARMVAHELKDQGIKTVLRPSKSQGTLIYTSEKVYPNLDEPIAGGYFQNPVSVHKEHWHFPKGLTGPLPIKPPEKPKVRIYPMKYTVGDVVDFRDLQGEHHQGTIVGYPEGKYKILTRKGNHPIYYLFHADRITKKIKHVDLNPLLVIPRGTNIQAQDGKWYKVLSRTIAKVLGRAPGAYEVRIDGKLYAVYEKNLTRNPFFADLGAAATLGGGWAIGGAIGGLVINGIKKLIGKGTKKKNPMKPAWLDLINRASGKRLEAKK